MNATLTVALVEDNDGDALIIDELFETARSGFEDITVMRFRSMAEFTAKIDDVGASCVLLDLGLPDASGTTAVTDAVAVAPDMPIVVLTGSDNEDLAHQALLAGAQDFLVKGPALTEDVARRAIRYAIDRSSQTRALRASRIELREFAHRVAHDLKSPLAVILGLMDLLRIRRPEGDDVELYDMATRSGRRLVDMVDRLLEYAESAGADGSIDDVALDDVVSWVTTTLDQALDGIDFQVDGPLPVVRASDTGLRHTFLNLIGNSIKFANPDRPLRIVVRGRVEGDVTFIEVSDNGRGIDPAHREEVFDLGTRVLVDQPGTGLGLATVRRTIELCGGTVTVDDGFDGHGATIRLALRSVTD